VSKLNWQRDRDNRIKWEAEKATRRPREPIEGQFGPDGHDKAMLTRMQARRAKLRQSQNTSTGPEPSSGPVA